jgi:hypothetical protein
MRLLSSIAPEGNGVTSAHMFSAENIFKLIAIKRVHYTEKGGIFK